MFSNSQLHALIFLLAGMLSTHFLAIGKFWKMKWNSMLEYKTGICFDLPCWFYLFCLNYPHSCGYCLLFVWISTCRPLFALGYPLCASIWVIETKSISDIRKLVTYWVLFSLITLFEDAFSNLLECIPFWPCIKLMVICWLVIPHFDGSYYVYQHLVQPGLSMDPQVVMNRRFNESKKLYHSRENFLVAADRYIKENGAEALEKLLASKWWKCEEPNVAQEEIPVVEVTEIKNVGGGAIRCEGPNAVKKEIKVTEVTQRTFSGTAQWVKQTEINLGETKSNTTCAAEIKERAAEIEACLHKKVQKEWACAVCQVTTQSEATFNSHLQGKRHKVTSKQLKAKKQATKISGSPPVSMAKKFDQSTKEEQPKCTSYNLKSKNSGISAASTVKNPDETRDDERQKCGSNNGPNEKNNKKQEEKALVPETSEQGHQNLKQNGDGMKELGSRCNICYVSCTSELDMTSHLNGRRHFNRVKQLSNYGAVTAM
ncbi:uncharacterized protein LOC117909549 isoform X5 [Vitis riparia]|uniref:uncharacterized protein LOC117909549 isoform X5 n=1 Tax=Vitis riparia TaxID=96939 RepID=UPI00155AED74|nr:uncharacterized protein LOC117909549 isoform X5 [Vitis riparia]